MDMPWWEKVEGEKLREVYGVVWPKCWVIVAYGRFGQCVMRVYQRAGCCSRKVVSLLRGSSTAPISEIQRREVWKRDPAWRLTHRNK